MPIDCLVDSGRPGVLAGLSAVFGAGDLAVSVCGNKPHAGRVCLRLAEVPPRPIGAEVAFEAAQASRPWIVLEFDRIDAVDVVLAQLVLLRAELVRRTNADTDPDLSPESRPCP